MAVSCWARTARSASGSSSRASRATLRTWSMSMGTPRSDLRGRERLPLDRPLHLAGPDALDADAGPHRLAILDHADVLKVRVKGSPAGAGDLLADPTQVLGLAAVGLLVAEDRLLAAHIALHAHDRVAPTNAGGVPARNV